MTRSSSGHPFKGLFAIVAGLGLATALVTLFGTERKPTKPVAEPVISVAHREQKDDAKQASTAELVKLVKVRPAPEYIEKGVEWLIKAQHPDGGWGAGSHASQQIRDPHAVQVDPATTAFVASALLRDGSTPVEGKHKDAVRRATVYLCGIVEESSASGPKITNLEGTQIQTKLGPLVDTAMTAQYLARVLTTLPDSDALHSRVSKAVDKCLAKLYESQQKDGSWNVGGGWASVLQSSLGCSALEYAQAAGKPVDQQNLNRARDYQLGNFDAKTGTAKTEAAAGVTLYAFSSSMRANAAQSKAADDRLEEAKKDGKLAADAPLTVENLKKAGVKDEQAERLVASNANVVAQGAFLNGGGTYSGGTIVSAGSIASTSPAPVAGPVPAETSKTAAGTLTIAGRAGSYAGDAPVTTEEALLAGFGNNGGEEFLSYMLAGESLVILGEKDWGPWCDKMSGRLAKVQNPDGSWSGHHCITSPVFCTAAVVQTMTADHDAELLARLAKEAAAIAKVDK